jgi:hypothetical protein
LLPLVPFVSQPPLAAPTEHTRNIYIFVNQINTRTRVKKDQKKRGTPIYIDMMS